MIKTVGGIQYCKTQQEETKGFPFNPREKPLEDGNDQQPGTKDKQQIDHGSQPDRRTVVEPLEKFISAELGPDKGRNET